MRHLALATAVPALALVLVAGNVFAQARQGQKSIVVPAEKFAKAKNVRIEQDKIDNFRYARLACFDTNAPVESISWTVGPEQAGDWHVLLKLRSGAAIPLDQEAAIAMVTEAVTNAEPGKIQIPARVRVTGSLGDESWQIVSLGRVTLKPGMKIALLPGTNNVPRYTDLHRITLLDPEFIGKTQPALPELPTPAQPVKK